MKRTRHGFTLVELLVVIAILAVLATVSVVGYTSFIQRANESTALQEMTQIRDAIIAEDILNPNFEIKGGKITIVDASDDYDTFNEFVEKLTTQLGDGRECDDLADGATALVLKNTSKKVMATWDFATGMITTGKLTGGSTPTPDPEEPTEPEQPGEEPGEEPETHECTSVCGTCGKCTDTACGEDACVTKCDCPPPYDCEESGHVDTNPADHTCDECGGVASECHGGTATCTEKATCDVCGQPYGNEPAGHNWVNGECLDCHNIAANYAFIFDGKKYSSNNSTVKLGSLNWTLDGDGNYWDYNGGDSSKGQQFGAKPNNGVSRHYTTLTLTSEFVYGVSKISIQTCGASNTNATITVTVGGVQIGTTQTINATLTEYVFESDTSLDGIVVITYTQTSEGALYLKSLGINASTGNNGGNGSTTAGDTTEISFATTAHRVSQDSSKQVWKNGIVTLTNNKNNSQTSVANYSNPVRFYKSSNIVVACDNVMTKIEFVCNTNSYATALATSIGTVSGASVVTNGSTVTVTFTTPVTSFTIASLSDQVRMNSISVEHAN